ncbi:MAG: response regulator [Bacillaceae bacterium]|nr:response regulator [Bacillaceae bacterium]
MNKKVLVVDSSALMRKVISDIISQDDTLEVVAIARNGLDAIEKIKRLNPDVVTLDITIPEINGVTVLKQIMTKCPLPVVMLSPITEQDAKASITCIEAGASIFL